MNELTTTPAPLAAGLSRLQEIALSESSAAVLEAAARESTGAPAWRRRKLAEAHGVLALSQIAPRLQVLGLDLMDALRVLVCLRCPVPLAPSPSGALEVGREAILGVTWPLEALSGRLPGYAFVQVLSPRIWHANVGPPDHPIQRVCLGASLPAGIRVSEILLMCFGALTLQTVQLDERDAAGVLHPAAARWWQQHMHLIPLSRVPFLGTADLPTGDLSSGAVLPSPTDLSSTSRGGSS